MAPTLSDGDDILVDGGDAAGRLRDGIYVLRMDDALMVKRVARAPGAGRISRSEEHTPELPSLMRISYAVFCLTKKTTACLQRPQNTLAYVNPTHPTLTPHLRTATHTDSN